MASATRSGGTGFTETGVGELFLGLGFLSLTAGLALVQFVMIGAFLGLPMIVLALIFLTTANFLVRGSTLSTARSVIGFAVFLIGVLLLIGAAGPALTVAYGGVRHALFDPHGPTSTDLLWPWLALAGPCAAAVLALGLWLRGGWLHGRVLYWAVIAALVGPVAVLFFSTMATRSLLDA